MQHRFATKIFGLNLLAAGAWLASACGGRAVISDGAGGGSAAGSAGATFGGAAQAGSGGCMQGCINIGCGVGQVLMKQPGACCAECVPEPICPCDPSVCPAGYHAELVNGACCPSCVQDPLSAVCRSGQANYATTEQQVLEKYHSLSCKVDSDCTAVASVNRCTPGCDAIAVSSSASQLLLDTLNQMALMDCESCPPPGDNLCVAPTPRCYAGRCAFDLLPK